jgi:ATP-binding cassette, subfamily B, bacterial PglK
MELRGTTHASLSTLLARLWEHIAASRRRQFALLVLLMVFASFAEALSIGAVLPFLGALTQPALVFARPAGQAFASLFGLESADQLLLPLTVLFCLATLLAATTRVLLLWVSTRLSFAFGSDLSHKVYRNTLHQPYSRHIERNSSEVINAIWTKVSEVIFFVLLPMMTVISSTIIILVVCAVLYIAVPKVALLAFLSLGLAYGLFVKSVKQRLGRNSERIAAGSTGLVRTLQEGLGGIRDVIIDNSQAAFLAEYRRIDRSLRRAQGENQIMAQSPRFAVEALGMLLIAVLAFTLSRHSEGVATTIPTLAAMALGMQRLLPAAQQLYSAWSNIHSTKASLRDVLALLDEPTDAEVSVLRTSPVQFESDIRLRDVGFRYQTTSPPVLTNVDLTIRKGSRVGFIGPTGCGKSTLLDIVMGLLAPSTGTLEVDGRCVTAADARSWQLHVAHVPQAVFLADSTIAENIAFGVAADSIDHAKILRVAAQAQLDRLVDTWPAGYKTRVGERGVQLSGGQRQRIGIARALYKNADVIVFDEATSALDSETENAVIRSVEALGRNVTVLMIAHRVHTLQGCDEVIELGHGTIVARHRDVASPT